MSACMTAAVALGTRSLDPNRTWDSLFYRSMAFNVVSVTRPDLDVPPVGQQLWRAYRLPAEQRASSRLLYFLDARDGLSRQPPYAYRVVTPLVARVLFTATGNIDAAFYAITFVSLAGAALFLALSVYALAGSVVPAIVAELLFVANPVTDRFNFEIYMLTDPLAFFLTAVAIFALVRRRPILFFVVCLVGVFNKETMLPLLVCYPLSEALIEGRVTRGSVITALAIGAGWYAFTRLLPVPVHTYSLLREFRGPAYAGTVAAALIATFGVLLIGSWRGILSPVVVSVVPFGLANVAGAWFVGDTHRAVAQATPVVVLAVLWLWPSDRLGRTLVLAPCVGYLLERAIHDGLGVTSPTVMVPLVAALLVSEVILARRLGKGGRRELFSSWEGVHLRSR
jgi:hypothetical protein